MNIANTEIVLAIAAAIGASVGIVSLLVTVRAFSAAAAAATTAASRAEVAASRAIELASEANRLATNLVPATRFNIAYLLSQEDGPQLADFFNGINMSHLILAPEYVKLAILSAAPYCAAHWGVGLPAAETIPRDTQKIIVVGDYADGEEKAKLHYRKIAPLACYGLYTDVIPAINGHLQ